MGNPSCRHPPKGSSASHVTNNRKTYVERPTGGRRKYRLSPKSSAVRPLHRGAWLVAMNSKIK